MVERFQICIFLFVIMIQNLTDLGWDVGGDWFLGMAGMMATVLGSELLVDWIKHAFVTKFNHLSPALYRKFLTILSSDFVAARLNTVRLLNPFRAIFLIIIACAVFYG
jgi:hypothetical protein